MTEPYPNLGFNPAPGVPDDVNRLHLTLKSATDTLTTTNDQLNRLRHNTDGAWVGQAGNAFRAHLDTNLVADLHAAQQSLEKATGVLQQWYGHLISFKDTAARLDDEMGAAKQAQVNAQATLRQAQASPDLKLIGRQFSAAELPVAQQRIDNAEAAVRAVSQNVVDAQDRIDSILKRARDLQHDCEQTAKRMARELKDAAHRLAPHEPGFWDRLGSDLENAIKGIGDWITKHQKAIHDWLTTISAVTGFLALVTPIPFDAAFAVVAAVTAAGALASDAFDPKIQQSVKDLYHDASTHNLGWHNVTEMGGTVKTVGLDAAGAIPGIGPMTKAGRSLTEVGGLGAATDIMSTAAKNPGKLVTTLDKMVPNAGLKSLGLIGAHTSDDFRLDTLARIWRGQSVVTHVIGDVRDMAS